MNHLIEHLHHLTHFDGWLHWCIWIALVGFPVVMVWIVLRVLLPLRHLAEQAERIAAGDLATFDAPLSSIREVEKLQRALQTMMAQLAAAQERELMYRSALTESQENERRHIAREIHDDTIQSLVVVAHSLERASYAASDAARQHLEVARQQIVNTIDNLRRMIAHLRSTVLDELGLAAAIETLCEDDPRLRFHLEGQPQPLEHYQELVLFRAAQEAIHNALRHAQASVIDVVLTYSRDGVYLTITDDGRGFVVPAQLRELALHGHYGLIGLRERVEHVGGVLSVESRPYSGTRLSVALPITQPELMPA